MKIDGTMELVMESFSSKFLKEAGDILSSLDIQAIEDMALALRGIRDRGGRLFFLGVGGSAASASHATNDFRKLAGFEAYCPSDNVAELTARVNDEGWGSVYVEWLRCSKLRREDGIVVFSVGGGDEARNISPNLVNAVQYAQEIGALITGIVGRDGGYTARVASYCILVPEVNASHVTPHTEAFHGVLWHLLVSHPALKQAQTKWESVL